MSKFIYRYTYICITNIYNELKIRLRINDSLLLQRGNTEYFASAPRSPT